MTATPTSQSGPAASTSSRQSIYEESTQYRHWRFSNEELACMRSTLNVGAVSAIRHAFENNSVSTPSSLFPKGPDVCSVARILRCRRFLECRGGTSPGEVICWQDLTTMRAFSFSRGSRSHRCHIPQAVLLEKHGHGLASKKCDVSLCDLDSIRRFVNARAQAHSVIPRYQDNQQPYLPRIIRISYPSNSTFRCPRLRVPRRPKFRLRLCGLASPQISLGNMARRPGTSFVIRPCPANLAITRRIPDDTRCLD